jgi:alpha-glucosidase
MGTERLWLVVSPSGALALEVGLDSGRLAYRVIRNGAEVVSSSRLGVVRTDETFADELALHSVGDEKTIEDRYELKHGKQREHTVRFRARTLAFTNGNGSVLELDLRAYDEGVAFRYRFPGEGEQRTITHELTTFTPAKDGRAWMQERQEPGYYTPAYENPYANGVPIGTPSATSAWDLPATFQSGETWLMLTESDLNESYFGGRLGGLPKGRTYTFIPPQPGEGDGVGPVNATVKLPWSSPWRAITVAPTATVIIESNLITHLATPSQIADPNWVKPGRSSWSWWSDNDSPQKLDALRNFIDLAAEFGWEYSLVDANWNIHSEDDIQALVNYAAERNVRLFFWYNSGGPHNKVPEEPRDRMFDRELRRAELAKIARWGVAGIKVDFFQSDKQDRIAQYIDILRDAADYKIMVNFHGCTIPRGWMRTWPHLMSMEAVRGAEFYRAEQAFADDAPRHNTILPFTRNVVGQMDYTPVTFSDNQYRHRTTAAHELALSVVFESGILHLADSADSYRNVSPPVRDVLRSVPSAWDETRCVAGEPGSHVVMARRDGRSWFVAGINGTDEALKIDLDLEALANMETKGARWHLLTDGRERDDVLHTPSAAKSATITMAPSGGFVVYTS